MKLLIVIAVVLLSGCATTKVGDLEILNDMGKSGKAVGSVLRTVDSSCKVLTGHSCDSQQLNTPQINRMYGELKQLPDYRRASLPFILQEIQIFTR
jgi:hypothetical protein